VIDGFFPSLRKMQVRAITTTLDLYSHVTETMQEDAAAKLDLAFRAAINRVNIE